MTVSMAIRCFIISALFAVIVALPSQAATTAIAAKAIVVEGSVTLFLAKEKIGRRVVVGTGFAEGDRIVTGEDSAVEMEFDTGSRIRIDESSEITILSLHRDDKGSAFSIFNLAIGKVRSFVTKFTTNKSKFEYHTKTATAGVAGTDFVIEVPDENSMVVYVIPDYVDLDEEGMGTCQDNALWEDGVVYVKGFDPDETSVDVLSCFMTTIISGMAPGRPVLLPDSLLFGAIIDLPFSGARPAALNEEAMMENIARRVSVPLKTGDPIDSSLQKLDSQYDQGQGASTGGGGSGSGGGGTTVSPVVTGEITINIGL